MGRLWTPAEDQFLRNNYGRLSPQEIADHLARTRDLVVWRAGLLGVRKPRNPLWSPAETKFLRDNYPQMQIGEICAYLGRSNAAVRQQAARAGISKIGRPDSAWTVDEDDLLSDLYGTMSPDRIAGLLGRSRSAIVHRAMKIGVNKRWRGPKLPQSKVVTVSTMRRDAMHHNYFAQVDSPVKAYLLGWLASDGNVKADGNCIRLRIAAEDEAILQLARDEFAPLHGITYYRTPYGKKLMASFVVTSGSMKQDLTQLGVTPNKSLTLQYPPIPPYLDSSFILGYFDGDGSLFRESGRYWRWNITSGSWPILVSIQDRIESATGIRPRGPHRNGGHSCACRINLNGSNVIPVDSWLHTGVPGLGRKSLARRMEVLSA